MIAFIILKTSGTNDDLFQRWQYFLDHTDDIKGLSDSEPLVTGTREDVNKSIRIEKIQFQAKGNVCRILVSSAILFKDGGDVIKYEFLEMSALKLTQGTNMLDMDSWI